MRTRGSTIRLSVTALGLAGVLMLCPTALQAQSVQSTAPPAVAPSQSPGPPQKPANYQVDLELLKQLRSGGLAIVMRHAPADPDKADITPLDFKNVRNQQPLTEAGRLAARQFGEALKTIGMTINEVMTSRYQRAVQTAQLAGFKDILALAELTDGSLVTPPNEQRRRAAALKQLLVAPIAGGANRLLVTHRANMMQAFGKEWFEVKEGEASVFRVTNGAYSLVARLQLADWQRLANLAQAPHY